jgi:RHS repeat-associated protein
MTTAAICATGEVVGRASFYRGEQYDSDLGLYYLRARYFNPATGRFMSRDPEDGKVNDPASLHKFLYANGDPVNGWDPSGRADVLETLGIISDNLSRYNTVNTPNLYRKCQIAVYTGIAEVIADSLTNPTLAVQESQSVAGEEVLCSLQLLENIISPIPSPPAF